MRPDLRGLVIQHSGISLSQVVATVCNRQEMLYNLLRNLVLGPSFPEAFCPDLLSILLSAHPYLFSQTSSVQTSQDSLSCRNPQLTFTYEKALFLLPSPLQIMIIIIQRQVAWSLHGSSKTSVVLLAEPKLCRTKVVWRNFLGRKQKLACRCAVIEVNMC